MMKLNSKQIAAVLNLPGPQRFEYFVKVVADWEEVWGLYQEGWALADADDGVNVFPFWPAREYAQLCAENEWNGYFPRAIPLDELMNRLLPQLQEDGVLPGIFYTPSNKGVTPSIDELKSAMQAELAKY
jgi:Protein of unknown function (DUF2750)